MISPSVALDSSFAALAIGGSYTSAVFTTSFMPLFDLYVAMDQAGTVQLQCAFQLAGSGSTFRNVDNPFIVVALGAIAFKATGYRVPNLLSRWVITNTSGVLCTITEIVIVNRSL